MPITRYHVYATCGDDDGEGCCYPWVEYEEYDGGEWVFHEDHLNEVARLEHIISGANDEIRRLAEENTRLKFEIAGGLESRAPRENACVEGALFKDHTEE